MLIALLTELEMVGVEVCGISVPILGFDCVDLGGELTLEPIFNVNDPILDPLE
jgi:hypothetical protein